MKRKFHPKGRPWFVFFALLYVALLASISILNHLGADRFWPGALNLYLPQAMWLLPGGVLLLWAFCAHRRWAWLPALCLLWVLGPVMGLCMPLEVHDAAGGDVLVRVMTCNTKYGRYDDAGLIADITRYQPDLLLFQDSEGMRGGDFEKTFLRTWQIRHSGQYVIASKLPISKGDWLPLSTPGEDCLRVRMRVRGRTVTVYNVHLQTPRAGLNAFRTVKRRPWYFPEAVERFEGNVQARLDQARALRDLVRKEEGPVLLAGDLNSPDSSLTCVILREAGVHDAFAEGGRGYGYTYGHKLLQHRLPWVRVSWMRIDHIMMSRHFGTLSCWTGNGTSSEHRPVLADLVLKGTASQGRPGR